MFMKYEFCLAIFSSVFLCDRFMHLMSLMMESSGFFFFFFFFFFGGGGVIKLCLIICSQLSNYFMLPDNLHE